MLNKNKFWIITFIIIIILSSIIIFFEKNSQNSSKIAYIYQDGKLLYEIQLDKVSEKYTIEIKDENQKGNTIMVEKDRICVLEADCSDKICKNMGWIYDSTKPIVCLPNKIIIYIGGMENAH